MTSLSSVTAASRGAKPPVLLGTPTATNLGRLFRVCQEDGQLGLVTGEPGVGKSSAARRFVAESEGAYLVTMSPAHSALVPCLEAVAMAVDASAHGSGAGALTKGIRSQLRYAGDPPILLIDEAHHMSDQSVEELRAIFDATPALGLVLIGSRSMRERWSGRQWAQLNSRVFQRMDIDAPAKGDVDAICAAAGIADKKSLGLLHRASLTPGGLRVVRNLLAVAARLAGPGATIAPADIEAAYQDRAE